MINQHLHLFVFSILIFLSCESQDQASKSNHLLDKPHPTSPQGFKADIVPKNKIIHKGIIGPEKETFYYTLSDKSFQNFNVYMIKHSGYGWSRPKEAFFNSEYDGVTPKNRTVS